MVNSEERSLYDEVREAVHVQWDPIGVFGMEDEMGEYDSYVPALLQILESRGSDEQVFEYLWTVETESMGLSGEETATRSFAAHLNHLALRRQQFEN